MAYRASVPSARRPETRPLDRYARHQPSRSGYKRKWPGRATSAAFVGEPGWRRRQARDPAGSALSGTASARPNATGPGSASLIAVIPAMPCAYSPPRRPKSAQCSISAPCPPYSSKGFVSATEAWPPLMRKPYCTGGGHLQVPSEHRPGASADCRSRAGRRMIAAG